MKTKFGLKTMLTMFGIFLALAVQAKEPDKKVALRIANAPRESINLTLKMSATGEVLYEKKLSKDSAYIKVFDLSNLPEGMYNLAVETENKVYEQDLGINAESCILFAKNQYYKPVFNNENGNLFITYPNPEQDNISVIFQNSLGSFFTDETEKSRFFKKKYSLKMLEPGDYQVDLVAGENNFNYSFEVR
jgi:hypothetical protein